MGLLSLTRKAKNKGAEPKKKTKVEDVADEAVEATDDVILSESAATGRMFLLQPLVTEKTITLQEHSVVAFRVPQWAQRGQIAQAFEDKYGMPARKIRTMNVSPKNRRRGATRGTSARWKKVYVTVDNVEKLTTTP